MLDPYRIPTLLVRTCLAGALALAACDGPAATEDAGPRVDGASPPIGDGGGSIDGGTTRDAGPARGPECVLMSSPEGLSAWGIDGTSYGVIRADNYARHRGGTKISPDGQRIALMNLAGELEVIAFDGSGSVVIASGYSSGVDWPSVAWSPDGTRIAVGFCSSCEITIHAADGSGMLSVAVAGCGAIGQPFLCLQKGIAWTGDDLVYPCLDGSADRLGAICRASTLGGAATVIWRSSPTLTQGAYVLDGSLAGDAVSIAVLPGSRDIMDLSRPVFPGVELVMRPDGSGPITIDGSGLGYGSPASLAFSPDGAQLLRSVPLALVSTSGGTSTPLPPALGFPDNLSAVDWGLRCP